MSLLLGAVLLAQPGCATTVIEPDVKRTVLDRIDCDLSVEPDSVAGELRLAVTTRGPTRFSLLASPTILLWSEPSRPGLKLVEEDGQYFVSIAEAGQFRATVKFLCPLAQAGDDQVRHLDLPLPVAMTNRVRLTIPEIGIDVAAPTAIRLTEREEERATVIEAILGPGDPAQFLWKHRARQRELEKTVFFATVTSVVRFDSGLVAGLHDLRLKVAQGQLTAIRVGVPGSADPMTVTAVEGMNLATWRYDPATREVEARLAKPAAGEYRLRLMTQMATDELPYDVSISALEVKDALHQHGTIGVVTSASVYASIEEHPQPMNAHDFARDASALLAELSPGNRSGNQSSGPAGDVHFAYRWSAVGERLVARVLEVRPEIRTVESAGFTVGDDRLVYEGRLTIKITKSGLFAVQLLIPDGYDVDTLGAEQVSHWDETTVDGRRVAVIHFKNKMRGEIGLQVALSRPISELPQELVVPRVEAVGVLKHTGQIVVTSARGVRLTVAARNGVSELNPLELGIRQHGTLAFRLLRPSWQLTLATEVVEPRITVDFCTWPRSRRAWCGTHTTCAISCTTRAPKSFVSSFRRRPWAC